MYLTFAEYARLGGVAVNTAAAYSPIEYAARKAIDRQTQKRVASMATVPEAVKMLMVELINIKASAERVTARALTSFTNDGYTETYSEPATAERIQAAETELIHCYLSGECDDTGTPLLWLGVN